MCLLTRLAKSPQLTMSCSSVTSVYNLAISATLIILVIMSSVEQSEGLPSSPVLLKNKLLSHVIRSRSVGRSQKYCGPNIVRILNLLCDGNYFSPSKRDQNERDDSKQNSLNNGIAPFWDDMTPKADYHKPSDGSDDYFLEPEKALNMFGGGSSRESQASDGFTRNRRGIVDECCRKPCTINELVSYCE